MSELANSKVSWKNERDLCAEGFLFQDGKKKNCKIIWKKKNSLNPGSESRERGKSLVTRGEKVRKNMGSCRARGKTSGGLMKSGENNRAKKQAWTRRASKRGRKILKVSIR